jgi:hypothetical protein
VTTARMSDSRTMFLGQVFRVAKELGFGHKKLHEDHFRQLYPTIHQPGVSIPN